MKPHEEEMMKMAHADRSTTSASQDTPSVEAKKVAVNQGDAEAMISQPTTNPHITIVNQQSVPQQSPPPRGVDPALLLDAADKSPGLAAFLSFVFVGLGQLYNGQIGKGILVMFVYFVGWGATVDEPGVLILVVIFWAWMIVDAYSVAKRKRLNWLMVLHGR